MRLEIVTTFAEFLWLTLEVAGSKSSSRLFHVNGKCDLIKEVRMPALWTAGSAVHLFRCIVSRMGTCIEQYSE